MKNDKLDAEAICEAAGQPHMRFMPLKTADQQNALVLHAALNLPSIDVRLPSPMAFGSLDEFLLENT